MQYQDKNDRERKKKITLNKNHNDYPLDLDPSPLLAKKQGRKEIQLRFEPRAFEEDGEDFKIKCEQLLRYGCKCQLFFQRKFGLSKSYMPCYISISEDANDSLYLYDIVDNKVEIIDIFKIADIEAGKVWPLSKQKNIKIPDDKDLWLSFFYEKSKLGVMLLFEKKETRDQLWAGFQNLVIEYKYKKMNREENSSYDDIMDELGQYDDLQQFTFKETKDIINRLQLKMSKKYLESIYMQINQPDKDKKPKDKDLQKITKRQLEKLIKTLMTHPEIFPTFEQYNGQMVRDLDQYSMSIDQFKHFLKTEQFENWNQKELASVFSYLSTDHFSDKLSFIGFCRLIFSKKNTLFDPNKCKYPQDMDQPLTNYYINSSRNIYSANLDLASYFHFPDEGEKGVEEWENKFKHIYFMLQSGVKFMELEIWDGDAGQGPMIQYGHTMTQKLGLQEMLRKLMKHVFDNNPFPFFISIESHCSQEQNQQAIKIIKQEVGNALYILPKNYMDVDKYPSPSKLKNKVILTGRIASWTLAESDELAIKNTVLDNIEHELQQVQYQDALLAKQKKNNINMFITQKQNINKPKLKSYLEKKHDPEQQEDSDNELPQPASPKDDPMPVQPPAQVKQENKNKLCKDLSGYRNSEGIHAVFGLYTHSIQCQGNPSMWEIYQMNLQELWQYNESDPNSARLKDTVAHQYQDLVSFSKQFLLKISPSGKKIDSINFNPLLGFRVGAQFCINHPQTFDISSLIYQAKFQENNGIGYVLKPPEFRDTTNAMQRSQKINVILKVVSGYQLRTIKGESIHPYVEVLLVQPNEKDNLLFQTKHIEENNFNPLWKSSNSWKFQVEQPDISFLVFQAISNNEQKSLLGWFAMPANSLRQGYRVVPLKDDHFCTIKNSYLLVHSEVSPRQF